MNPISLDELLTFPNDDTKTGGGIDHDFSVILESGLTESMVNIHTIPVILTAKAPAEAKIPKLSEFLGATGLTKNDIVAVNGEAVHKVLNDPTDKSKELLPYLFIIPAGKSYEDISEISAKQIAFICFFHHLFFLAKIAKIPSFPMFTDSFSEKFVALQQKLSEESETKTKIFGAETVAITAFWTELSGSLGVRETLFDMIGLFEKSPQEIYEHLLKQDEAATVINHEETSTTRGFNEMSEVEGTVYHDGEGEAKEGEADDEKETEAEAESEDEAKDESKDETVAEPRAVVATDTEEERAEESGAEPTPVVATDTELEKLEKIMD